MARFFVISPYFSIVDIMPLDDGGSTQFYRHLAPGRAAIQDFFLLTGLQFTAAQLLRQREEQPWRKDRSLQYQSATA
jgi:hypothetical protein